MKLESITVENFRSITKAYKIRLSNRTVLVGPNNEGKSNVLLALVTAMNILTNERAVGALHAGQSRFRLGHGRLYEWERDFPIHLQGDQPEGVSAIVLEFGLAPEELAEFRAQIRSRLSGTLPIRIELGPNSTTQVRVYKKGPGAEALSKSSPAIAAFVSERIRLEHIPAVRTASSAQDVVENLVAQQLRRLEKNEDYQKAVKAVAAIQEPVLRELAANIKGTLVQFLKDVKDVRITIRDEARYRSLRQSVSIVIDDGTATELQYKGDGVQSLAALAIMRHASEKGVSGRQAVIAVEEPESHLHPKAIHELREVLNEMSDSHQIVLTTHNPLFVDRLNIPSNIIVSDNKARPARSLEESREVLGVRASDNLKSAALVLVVEGEDDRVALQALLRHQATRIRAALGSGMLAIDSLQGGSNLAYKLGLLRDSLCTAYCFCDDDTAGRDAVQKAREQGLLTMADFTLAHCDGRAESEIEDLYDPAVYEAMIKSDFGVSLTSPRFKNSKKWSTRVRDTFEQQGKPWSDALEAEVKDKVARAVAADPSAALVPATRTAFDALVASLIERLDRIQPGKGEHMTQNQKTASAEEATLALAGVR